MKNIDKILSAHAIAEALEAEAEEYDTLLNDYAVMADENELRRSEWEKTWRDEFEHHVASLREVIHLLAEFIGSEEVSEDAVNGSGE